MRCALPVALALALVSAPAPAQTVSARIEGVVTDPTGSAVPDALIEVTEAETGVRWTAPARSTGRFVVSAIPPGTYRLTVRRSGFKTALVEGIGLAAGDARIVNVALAVGDVVDAITVVAAPVTLAGTPAQAVETRFGADETTRVPVNGRNYLSLVLAAPGVTATNPQSFTTGERMTSGGRPYLNGHRKETTSYALEGVDINQYTDNVVAYLPSPDALESVTLTTGAASAEWGNYLGGVVSTRLKSGTNVWHGSAFGFLRDEELNATNWAAKWQPEDPLNPGRKAPLSHWTAGGTAGGPIARNRVFVFADYQAVRRDVGPRNGLTTVATDAIRAGDFSYLLSGPNPQQLYDPLTTRPDPANPGRYLRDPFPGNRIPLSRFGPVAAALFAHPLYPRPDHPGLAGNGARRTTSALEISQGDVKIDARLASRHVLSAHVSASTQRTAAETAPVIFTGGSTRAPMWSAGVRLSTQGESNWANEALVGLSDIDLEMNSDDGGEAVGALASAIGIAGANDRRDGLPAISFGGALSTVGNTGVVQRANSWMLQLQDTLTWSLGRHIVKAGGRVLLVRQDSYFSGNNGQMGMFEFNGHYTRDLGDPRSIGSPIADFVLGYPARAARGDIAEAWQHQQTISSAFVQSDWRPAVDVTLNLGLRYEYRTPLVEAQDRQVTYDLATGEARFAGRDGNSRALYEPFRNDWQPRVGVVWAPSRFEGRRALRAGYGVSSFQEGTGTNLRLPLNPPYFNELDLTNSPADVGVPVERGFEGIRERDAMTGAVLRALDPNFRPARSHQWHVTGEAAVGSFLVSVGYVGQVGSHLAVPVNANQAAEPGGPRPLDPFLPQIGSVILTTSIGKQRYDSLQTVVRRTYANGWSLIATHTWEHAFSDSRGYYSDSGQSAEPATFWPDPRDQAAEWGPSAFDARHHLTVGWTLDLPVGRGRRWGAEMPAWADAVVGGWSVDGLWRAHTGYAITVLAPDVSQTGARSGRPDRLASGEGSRVVGPDGTWFDTSAFVLPQLGTFGNAGTGIVRGPGLNVVDLAVDKSFATGGGSRLRLRVEAYNLLNTPVFNAPDRSLTSATFGQIRSSQLEREVQVGVRWVF
ncbi:MAG: carboxypeptidase regulatory-like domain-containing protein [Acidobacteria bacterium]|nr:carboxypeptidase regulatory-like domain-containing protein [Acidobacteriota bacterium]